MDFLLQKRLSKDIIKSTKTGKNIEKLILEKLEKMISEKIAQICFIIFIIIRIVVLFSHLKKI